MAQLQRDLALLEAMHVMDYSLLLGVHFRWVGGWGRGMGCPLPLGVHVR